jgi:hypothetical protein
MVADRDLFQSSLPHVAAFEAQLISLKRRRYFLERSRQRSPEARKQADAAKPLSASSMDALTSYAWTPLATRIASSRFATPTQATRHKSGNRASGICSSDFASQLRASSSASSKRQPTRSLRSISPQSAESRSTSPLLSPRAVNCAGAPTDAPQISAMRRRKEYWTKIKEQVAVSSSGGVVSPELVPMQMSVLGDLPGVTSTEYWDDAGNAQRDSNPGDGNVGFG